MHSLGETLGERSGAKGVWAALSEKTNYKRVADL
jgi:hypothetical protein